MRNSFNYLLVRYLYMEAVLFYSNNCELCKQLPNYKTFKTIDKICIDSKSVRKRLPPNITTVPSILIRDRNNSQVIDNKDVFKWFQMVDTSGIPIKSAGSSSNEQQSPQERLNQQAPQQNSNELSTDFEMNYFADDNFSSTHSSLDGTIYNNFESNTFSTINERNDNLGEHHININDDTNNKKSEFEENLKRLELERNNL
jgi:hypothetical protein